MSGNELLRAVLGVVFALNGFMLTLILVAKPLHRRRQDRHDRRRTTYLGILSRHLATDSHEVWMGRRVAEDRAFLDALIDLRSIVTGEEAEALGDLVDRYEIAAHHTRNLGRRWRIDGRLRSAVALAELGDDSAASALMQHLSDRSQEIRIQCARGLARMRWAPAINAILERLELETPWVRSRLADALVDFGRSATWPVLTYVNRSHRHLSVGPAAAIRVLGTIGDQEAVEPLLQVLEDATDPEIQIAVVETLGVIGAPLGLEAVDKAARSEDWRVRAKAATALATVGDESVVSTLAAGLRDQSWWVRRNSAAALASFGKGIDTLYLALHDEDPYAGDAAAEALADAGELLAARDHIDAGTASRRHFDLVEHVGAATARTG